MSKKFYVVKGLPRSGKTEMAMQFLNKLPNAVRISKDDLREMLRKGQPWDSQKEKIALQAEQILIGLAKQEDKDIIIDDTNFNKNHIARYRKIAEMFGYQFELYETERSVEKCIEADAVEKFKVGRDAIYNMAFKNQVAYQTEEFVIYGLDGTLINHNDRLEFATANNEILDTVFYDEALLTFDDLNHRVRSMLMNDFNAGYEIILLTYRPERLRAETEGFLRHYSIPFTRLIMRPDDNEQNEVSFKINSILILTDPKLCYKLYDDNEKVIKYAKELGLITEHITSKLVNNDYEG